MQKGTGWKESASLRNSFLYRLPQTAKAVTLSSFGVHGKPIVCRTTVAVGVAGSGGGLQIANQGIIF